MCMHVCGAEFLWVRGIPLNLGSSQSRARGVPGVMARGIPDAIARFIPLSGRGVPGGGAWAAHIGIWLMGAGGV